MLKSEVVEALEKMQERYASLMNELLLLKHSISNYEDMLERMNALEEE